MEKLMKEKKNGNSTDYYSYEDGHEVDAILVYSIDHKKNQIIYYVKGLELDGSMDIDIIFDGFTKVSEIEGFSTLGYITSKFQYLLKEQIQSVYENVKSIKIKKSGKTGINKKSVSSPIELSYEDYLILHNKFKSINGNAKRDKRIFVTSFLNERFPLAFPLDTSHYKLIAKNIIGTLDPSIIPYMDNSDKKKVDKFYSNLIEGRYKSHFHKAQKLSETKIKIDTQTLDDIISEFESLLSKTTTDEAKLSKFLKDKIFLTTGKYIGVIPEIHLKLGGARKVDFGLLDVWNYLDIYEIKTHKTKLLSTQQDRGNYYWHPDTTKAIVQAEKYLHHAKKKASNLRDDLIDELTRKSISIPDFKVIEPKAFLIVGHSRQLNNQAKKDDFRILKQGLKNIEIILYDELLETLKNQRNKFISK